MAGVFVSYRRGDSSGWAGRIHDHVASHVGESQFFMDVSDIDLGDDFRDVIRRRLSVVDTVIVVIGPDWLTIEDKDGSRRLDDPGDVATRADGGAAVAGQGRPGARRRSRHAGVR